MRQIQSSLNFDLNLSLLSLAAASRIVERQASSSATSTNPGRNLGLELFL